MRLHPLVPAARLRAGVQPPAGQSLLLHEGPSAFRPQRLQGGSSRRVFVPQRFGGAPVSTKRGWGFCRVPSCRASGLTGAFLCSRALGGETGDPDDKEPRVQRTATRGPEPGAHVASHPEDPAGLLRALQHQAGPGARRRGVRLEEDLRPSSLGGFHCTTMGACLRGRAGGPFHSQPGENPGIPLPLPRHVCSNKHLLCGITWRLTLTELLCPKPLETPLGKPFPPTPERPGCGDEVGGAGQGAPRGRHSRGLTMLGALLSTPNVISPCRRSCHQAGGCVAMPKVTSPCWRSRHHGRGHTATAEVMPPQ